MIDGSGMERKELTRIQSGRRSGFQVWLQCREIEENMSRSIRLMIESDHPSLWLGGDIDLELSVSRLDSSGQYLQGLRSLV